MLEATSPATVLIARRLGRAEIFADLSEAELLAMAEFCNEVTFDEGDSVLVEDEPADKLFIVERGKLALEKKVQLGRHSTPRAPPRAERS